MALAVVEGAGDDGDGAVGFETDAAHFVAGGGGDFEVVADAAAADFAAGAGGGLARVVDQLVGLITGVGQDFLALGLGARNLALFP